MEIEKSITLLIPVIILLGMNSCYYDVEEELYPTLECDTNNISYSNDIVPILSTNCYQCHDTANNFGNITMDSHATLLVHVDNGRIEGAINHESGFSAMPQGLNKLLDCEIEKIESWIGDGAPNN